MLKEFKYSEWYIGGKLFLVYIFSIILNFIILTGFVGIFNDSLVWSWIITAITLIVHFTMAYMFIASDGRRDMQVDCANEKRKERNPKFSYVNKFNTKKGFIAGAISQIPIIILYVFWLITKKAELDFVVRLLFSHYYKLLVTFNLNPIAIISYIIVYCCVTGLAYMRAKSYRKKLLTIIERNKEKAIQKGLINNEK
jgi:uncharacterized membrane protein